MIYENNVFEGSYLGGGANIALHLGGTISKHIYYANNKTSHLYRGDHECLTFDGHGGAYFGKVKNVKGTTFTLVGKPQTLEGKGTMADLNGTAIYIVDGPGAGQYRFLEDYDNKNNITIDRPWDVAPDDSSIIEIGGFNGRHLIINNEGEDVGTLVQLYPTNCQCFVVGNKGKRAMGINSLGFSGQYHEVSDKSKFTRFEVSWYNQFLDNEIVVGNGWGGGTAEVDGWLGGGSTLLIHGNARMYSYNEKGERLLDYQTPEWVQKALGEKEPRDTSIPVSRFQVVRGHIIRNNSSIRIRGCVADAVIEHCKLANSRKGIRVDMEVKVILDPRDLGMLKDYAPDPSEECPVLPFLRPSGVLIRKNCFENIQIPYSGTALDEATIEN